MSESFYECSFDWDQVHYCEDYESAEGLLAHLNNVGSILEEAFKIAELTRLGIQHPEEELAKLRLKHGIVRKRRSCFLLWNCHSTNNQDIEVELLRFSPNK